MGKLQKCEKDPNTKLIHDITIEVLKQFVSDDIFYGSRYIEIFTDENGNYQGFRRIDPLKVSESITDSGPVYNYPRG